MFRAVFGDARTRPMMIGSIVGAVLAAGFALFPSLFSSVRFVRMTAYSFAMFAPLGAIAGVLILRHMRVGDSLHCPSCDYEFAYAQDASIDHPSRCPECGCEWLGRLVKGHNEVPWPRIVVLALCASIGLAFIARNVAVNTSFGTARAPIWLLEQQIRSNPGLERFELDRAWSGLRGRTIDPRTEERIAELAIDSIRRDNHEPEASNWLVDLYNSGRMSPTSLSRYLHARVEASAEVIESAGGHRLVVRAIDHDLLGIGAVSVVLDRCWIEPGGTEIARQDDWFAARGAHADPGVVEVRLLHGSRAPGGESLALALPADAQGQTKLRLWVFWTPGLTPFSRVSPRRLAADQSLDGNLQLLTTIELSDPIPPQESRHGR